MDPKATRPSQNANRNSTLGDSLVQLSTDSSGYTAPLQTTLTLFNGTETTLDSNLWDFQFGSQR